MSEIKTVIAIVAVLVIVFSILGISSSMYQPLQAGVITAKEHFKPYERLRFIVGVPITDYEPERYVIWVGSRSTVEEWDVSKELFEKAQLGQFITRQEAGKK